MNHSRAPVATVGFIDDYCTQYQSLFDDVRNFESFKFLHVGILSSMPRKSLPEIAKIVGLKDGQSLHHFLRDGSWEIERVRQKRLEIVRAIIGARAIILCIDETGDAKKGKATDYVAKQYIGNLGQTENGIVSVNAYAVVDDITYPLLFRIFKPKARLKPGDEYKTKPQLAAEIIAELQAFGFVIELVLADSLYGESGTMLEVLYKLKLSYIVAIRSNHAVWLPSGQQVYCEDWMPYEQPLVERPTEHRYIREIIFGRRRAIRYYQITKGRTEDPNQTDTWQIMTNLEGEIQLDVGRRYTLRTWIEYGFQQVKHQLGWHNYRLTDYKSIERWWEIVLSAYLLVSCQAEQFKRRQKLNAGNSENTTPQNLPFSQHPHWELGKTWKSALNNLRLLLQPYCCWGWLEPWLQVFHVPGLRRAFLKLMDLMDTFHFAALPTAQAA
ncbi:MAG: IS701 family transposase [Myxacorys californica WJT36-NPBG1]|jgi:SRSO17 transposase|nr:IS701 family transposase [Myxacorys californica WJT36-NPBG1]